MPILDYFEDQSIAAQTDMEMSMTEERKAEATEESEAPGGEEETKAFESDRGSSKASTAATKPRGPPKSKKKLAPYIYTVMFNKDESLLLAGGAGRNEFKVFDWKTEQVVALINNVPKGIISGAMGTTSDRFAFGCMDSNIRLFDFLTLEELQRF